MSPNDPDQPEIFSREWYNEYFRRAVSSPAHSQFCQRVYGIDLCQHGLMDKVELDFLISLIEPNSKILEVGWSNGHITEYIHERTAAQILGIDFSDVAIEQALARTRSKSKSLRFAQVDLTREAAPGGDYDYIILIDSIYFLGEFQDSLARLGQELNAGGRMIVSVFDVKQEDDPDDVLLPDQTSLARALKALGLSYTWHDFTANVRAHGRNNYQVVEELKTAFIQEGNQFLYEARAAENRFFKQSAEQNRIVRYMYVIAQDASG